MQVAWLEHLLADRGIHGKIIEARVVGRGSDLLLDVRMYPTDENGKKFVVFDGETRVPEVRHLVPLGGMVFEPA